MCAEYWHCALHFLLSFPATRIVECFGYLGATLPYSGTIKPLIFPFVPLDISPYTSHFLKDVFFHPKYKTRICFSLLEQQLLRLTVCNCRFYFFNHYFFTTLVPARRLKPSPCCLLSAVWIVIMHVTSDRNWNWLKKKIWKNIWGQWVFLKTDLVSP